MSATKWENYVYTSVQMSKILHLIKFTSSSSAEHIGSQDNNFKENETDGWSWLVIITEMMACSSKISLNLLWFGEISKIIPTSFETSIGKCVVFDLLVNSPTPGYFLGEWRVVLFIFLIQYWVIMSISIMPYWFTCRLWIIILDRVHEIIPGLREHFFNSDFSCACEAHSWPSTDDHNNMHRRWFIWHSSSAMLARRSTSVVNLRNVSD